MRKMWPIGSINTTNLQPFIKKCLKKVAWLRSRQRSKPIVSKINTSQKNQPSPLHGWSLRWKINIPQLKLSRIRFSKPRLPKLQPPKVNLGLFGKIGFIILIGIAIYQSYVFAVKDLPHPADLKNNLPRVTTKILSRDGEVLFRIYEDENRTLVGLSQIPDVMKHATIAIEDKSFYQHHGFSISGIIRAGIANSQEREIQQGGSTITQQLVKNRLLTTEKTFKRKVRELLLSMWVETQYSKDEILEMYFNQVPYGGATYGVEEAAVRYFGKSVSQLNLAESALLAGLPVAPSAYSPFSTTPELAKQRQLEVLRRMVEDGYISQEQADQAWEEPLNYQADVIDLKAPHFVMYVKKLLADQYGEMMVNQGGLEVTTTLDLNLQETAQQIVSAEIDKLTRLRVSNGAALITNPQTGEILAMIGSHDYYDFEHDGQVNVTLRPRQPGSSIKPITYALALEQGKTPSTIIDDSPITYQTAGSPAYSPKNYDGQFHGKVTLRQALASSYNVPAVKTLAEIGVSTLLDRAPELGIDTWQDRSRFGLSLTLGGGEVTMTDMAELYSTFATGGYTVELNPILEVKNANGATLYRNTCVLDQKGCPKTKTLNSLVASQINDILSDNQARTPAFGPFSVLNIPGQEVAVKTGTTNSLRDNWTIGYVTDRLVAVWVGNNDNTPMSYVASGITGASPIWNQLIRLQLSAENPHSFVTPEEMIKVKICAQTGTLPCAECPQVIEELFIPGTAPTGQCNANWFKTDQEKQNPNRDKILEGSSTN